MLPTKLRSGVNILKSGTNSYFNFNLRPVSNAETLEPVQLSYATYESTVGLPEGQAPPLIIMHGLFGSKGNWNSLCKVYQQKTSPERKIIAIDARNHGDSPHSQNHTYAHMAADIKALLEHLHLDKVALLGHSMGGRAVMLFALKYPELVDRLIVVDISPVRTSPLLSATSALFQTMENINLPSDMPLSKARTLVDSQLSKTIPDKSLRAFLLTNLIQRENGSYDWRINIKALVTSFNNIAKFPLVNDVQYTEPVLFVGGANSDFIDCHQLTFHQIPVIPFITKMFSQFHLQEAIKKLPHIAVPRPKSTQQRYVLQTEDNLDLAYASYELTKSYSKNNPEPTPLVILHGLLGSKNNWNSFCKKYHDNSSNKVFALDARNHGDSPHSSEHSYDDLVIDFRRFMYKQNINKVNLLGHSMGGRAAMLFALKYPELVQKLIIADISPITTSFNLKRMTRILIALKKVKLPKNVSLLQAKRLVSEHLMPFVKSKTLTAFLLTNLVQKSDGSFTWMFNVKALIENFENITTFPEIHHIAFDGPVLFVGGAKSDYIQKSDFPKMLKFFPNAELKFIEGAGHWVHSEKPAEFLQLTLDFLNKKVVTKDSL